MKKVRLPLLILIAVIVSAALATTVFADGRSPDIDFARLNGINVGIKIELANALTEDIGLVVNGKTFDCVQVSDTVIYCTGPLRPGDVAAPQPDHAKWQQRNWHHNCLFYNSDCPPQQRA